MKTFRDIPATLAAFTLLLSPWNVRATDDPNSTVGPQSDGSIVASGNQALTPPAPLSILVFGHGLETPLSRREKAADARPFVKAAKNYHDDDD